MAWKSLQNPMFRNQFSEDTFFQKYRHTGCETWGDLARTLVRDVCNSPDGTPYIPQDDQDQLARYITDLKFIPGGRYLYYAGRSNRFWNNCLSRHTRVLTDKGWVRLGEVVGQTLNVLSPVTGEYLPAEFKSHGVQRLNRITFEHVRGKSTKTWTVRATRTHHWPLIDGSDTYDLRVGDVVPANAHAAPFDPLGFAHGFLYGDGNARGVVRLCGAKAKWLDTLKRATPRNVTYPDSYGGDPVVYFDEVRADWKTLPGPDKDAAYTGSFIQGWLAADGSTSGVLSSVDRAALEFFEEYAPLAGVVVTGTIRSQVRDVKLGEYEYKGHTIWLVNYKDGADFSGFKVTDIRFDSEDEVFCPFEPRYNRIVIDHGIDTYQCYLLKSESDDREDWAETSKKAELCLMTGGGIGNCYTVYRGEGSVLHGTGGMASGPVPKALMINEIGRRVMQGGSRRSAIYGSLHHYHPDVWKFLYSKDWKHMPIAGARKEDGSAFTIWDAKVADFNYPAPLDMTNISINYDTAWLLGYWKTGDPGELFVANCKQALSTAEPGLSFNFFAQENDYLRNACCEVVSSDDSDVCNLGSLNLSRIESVAELLDVTALATQFLLCGTLGAKLPYDKVYQVREKNRRLGLGLMGVHEWLLQRNHPYEVTPELHRWLAAYRGASDRAAIELADRLGISRPVARRAIAPTGTIGILAGTTTGIEPLFGVAYKRRFLKGTTWHYQFVIDGAAQEVIDRFGTDPDTIDSALSMATDFEKRIRFQADVQDYVDMAISSTINLPAWGTPLNNEDTVRPFALTLARYAHRLRGFTCYPDGSRGGQPLTVVPYKEAKGKLGETFREKLEVNDVCSITGRGGSCGV